jgi:hypothetical protein
MPKGTSKKDLAHPDPLELHRALPAKLTLEETFAAMAADPSDRAIALEWAEATLSEIPPEEPYS